MGYLTVEEGRKAILKYITQNPGEPYYVVAKFFGYTPQYIGRLAKEAGLPARCGGKRLSRVNEQTVIDLVRG
jgi:hypothetical protein